ncbi:MAG TPA: PIG-L family deacetylase [Chloroflexia bacterium]|nr:PIG-L family deacetylase [Chloroflexia bacterium]
MWSSLRRAGRPLLRQVLYPALEATWAAGFALAGRYGPRRPVARWQATDGQRVGIVAPHPDDETAGCGGVMGRHRAAGHPVAVLVVTDGGASRAGAGPRAARVARRAAEAHAALAVLGTTALDLAQLPEGAWAAADGERAIARWLAAQAPTVVYAPSCIDYHPEHLRVARALAAVLGRLPPEQQPEVRIYEIFVPLGPRLIDCLADIGTVRRVKAAALACYTSQAAGLAPVPRRDHYLARYYGLGQAAEGFCTLTVRQYAALIAAGDWGGRPSPFRGLRGRPVSDPLAYATGHAARRRLQRGLLAAPGPH